MSEDQFTSVQWDREGEPIAPTEPIPEEEEHQEESKQEEKPQEEPESSKLQTPKLSPPPTPEFFLETSVSAPFRDVDTNSKPFMSYMLTTVTDNPAILQLSANKHGSPQKTNTHNRTTIKTRRRYGDFRILHDSLANDFPTHLIPPLPSKSNFKYLTGDTFSQEFVNKRLHSLDRFIKFILHHAQLRQSSIFYVFVSDSGDWATFVKNSKASYKDDENSGLVNKVVNEDLITETVMNFLTPAKHKKETNRDILEINDKLAKLYSNLTKLDKLFTRMNKKNADLGQDYALFSQHIRKLSVVQAVDLSEAKGDENEVPDDPEGVLTNFKIFAESLDHFSKSWDSLHAYIDESFLVTLKDCAKYIVSLTHLIEQQHNKKIDLQVLQDYLLKSKNDLVSIAGEDGGAYIPPPNPVLTNSNNGGVVHATTQLIKDTISTSATPHIGSAINENKVQKLRTKIAQLEAEIEAQTKIVNELTNRIINEEYPNWDRFNRKELKDAMLGFCDQNIDFYSGLSEKWAEVEEKLVKRLESL